MLSTAVGVLVGVLVVVAITVLTGYFVAQEFGYMAVDRSRLRARANAGDAGSRRALGITGRTSFMLSGAQLGITVTGLVAGYVAEPMIGSGIGTLLGAGGVPAGVGVAIGAVVALVIVTVVQMVFGELFPKNLAIARPEPVARWLAWSTALYLAAFGWLIRIFDAASNLLLRVVRIKPVHDVEHAATPRDLESIIEQSRDSGDLPPQLSVLLDRVLAFSDRPARAAMIPRPEVDTVPADARLSDVVERMASGHSRYPVTENGVDDVIGVIYLRDLLLLTTVALADGRARDLARAPLFVPDSLHLSEVLARLRAAGEEIACVVDEHGGFAGVVTTEDVAEELVGEITDEHDPDEDVEPRATDGVWSVPGGMHVDEVERLLGHDLPQGDYTTIGGLILARLGRLPDAGDAVAVDVSSGLPPDDETSERVDPRVLIATVRSVHRRVPDSVELHWAQDEATPETGLASKGDISAEDRS